MCSNPCEFEVTCFRPESNRGPYGLLHFLSAALSTTELWWRMNHRKSVWTLSKYTKTERRGTRKREREQERQSLRKNNIFRGPDRRKPTKTMAKIELCRRWGPRPSANVNHRQSGFGLHQRGWLNDVCATPQRRPRHELAWIWTDFLSEQRQATDFVEPAGGRAANDSLHYARAKHKVSSQ